MKLTTGILVLAMSTGAGWAQNPDLIVNTKNTMNALQKKNAIDSNAALAAAGVQTAPANPSAAPAKPVQSAPAVSQPAAKAAAGVKVSPVKSTVGQPAKAAVAHKPDAQKPAAKTVAVIVPKTAKSKPAAPKSVVAAESGAAPEAKPQDEEKDKKFSSAGKRDPFLSPVVTRNSTGSACSTGKKCLEIGQINLKGVVRADAGMIAVVTNSLNKAYFLRENDPVFNGYVVKITGDSITFKETYQDQLGKPLTREVVKKITTPAV
jgi:Tfp pilus assembly protein PilP